MVRALLAHKDFSLFFGGGLGKLGMPNWSVIIFEA